MAALASACSLMHPLDGLSGPPGPDDAHPSGQGGGEAPLGEPWVPLAQHQFGDARPQQLVDLAVAPDGGVVLLGTFRGELFDEQSEGPSTFVAKLDADGNRSWSRAIRTSKTPRPLALAVGSDGAVHIVGSFVGSLSLDDAPGTETSVMDTCLPLATDGQDDDAFVAKFSGGGECEWWHRFGGAEEQVAADVAVGPEGIVYLTGWFRNALPLPGKSPALECQGTERDMFVLGLSPAGDLVYDCRYGGYGREEGRAIAVQRRVVAGKTSMYVAVAGVFDGAFQLTHQHQAHAGTDDVFVAWSKNSLPIDDVSFGGDGSDTPTSLTFDAQGNIVVAGTFDSSELEYEDGMKASNGGGLDGFVAQFSPQGSRLFHATLGGEGDQRPASLASDGSDMLVAGSFERALATDSWQAEGTSGTDLFLARYRPHEGDDALRNLQPFAAAGDERPVAVALAPEHAGRVWFGGDFADQLDIGAGPMTSAGDRDLWLVQLEP